MKLPRSIKQNPFYRGLLFGIGILTTVCTGALVAVAVSGTINTFTNGETLDSAKLNTNFASLKTAVEGIPSQKAMRLIYETDVTTTQDFIDITGLDGNTDLEYQIITRIINGCGSASGYGLRFNNIASSVYGWKAIGVNSGTATDVQAITSLTYMQIGNAQSGTSTYSNGMFIAKTGYSRIIHNLVVQGQSQATNTIYEYYNFASIWNDSTTNITSIRLVGSVSNCIGAGSHIEVWARR